MKLRNLSILIFFITVSIILLVTLKKISVNGISINISYFNRNIVKRLSTMFPEADINIGNTTLSWTKSRENIVLLAQDIEITDKDSDFSINIPEFYLNSEFGLFFIWKDLSFSSIIIPKVNVKIKKIREKIAFDKNKLINNIRKFMTNTLSHNISLELKSLAINILNDKEYYIDSMSMKVQKKYDEDILNIEIRNNDFSTKISVLGSYRNILSISAMYNEFDIKLLKDIVMKESSVNFEPSLKATGSSFVEINEKNEITTASINIKKLNGNMILNNYSKHTISDFVANLKYTNKLLNLTSLKFQIDTTKINGVGHINLQNNTVNFKMTADSLEARKLSEYWKKDLYTSANRWYSNNILSGNFSNIVLTVETSFDKLKTKELPEVTIEAEIKDFITKFSKEFEPLKIKTGKLDIKNRNFLISVNEALFRKINIYNSVIQLNNMSDENSVLQIYGYAKSSAVQIYDLVYKGEDIKFNKDMTFGNAASKFHFEIHNTLNDRKITVNTSFQSQITSLEIQGLYENFNIKNSTINIMFYDNHLNMKGEGIMNNQPVKIEINNSFNNLSNSKFNYEISAYFSENDIQKYIPFKYASFHGGAFANIKYSVQKDNLKSIKAKIQLINLQSQHLDIFEDKTTTFNFDIFFKDKTNITLEHAIIKNKNIKIECKGSISDIVDLFFYKIDYLESENVTAKLTYINNSLKMDVKGNYINFNKLNFKFNEESDNVLKKIKIDAEIKKALMHNNIMINNLKIHLNHSNNDFHDSYLTGEFTNNVPLIIRHSEIGLEAHTEDAGSFFKAFNILNIVNKGKLSLYLYPLKKGYTASGMISLTRFHVAKASILAQILTLSSLTGIANVLNGQGIYFTNFNLPLSYSDGILKFSNSWMESYELGISLSGNINILEKYFDIKGQIIPAYSINKTIWSIPLLGKLLTGGYSRGLIAIEYKVTGNSTKSHLYINPISTLMPNILKSMLSLINERFIKSDQNSQNNQQKTIK